MLTRASRLTALGLLAALALSACEDFEAPGFLGASAGDDTAASAATTRLVERDVEAPEVFQANEPGLWDGRPSLGGVWVAYPGVTDPERVLIRNESNGKFVIGALFRREIETPGPKLMVSSDAASALGMLAGQPTELSVTALRREELPDPEAEPDTEPDATPDARPEPRPETETAGTAPDAPEQIDSTALAPVAAAAIDRADAGEADARPGPPPVQASRLNRPYIQIGLYSVEDNAEQVGEVLREAGIVPTIRTQESRGNTFWRVLVGPAANAAERGELLKKVNERGFSDAYLVTN
ncbi:rare lipoprotein A [Rhodovulum iodosum]|uniref:Rare lipoprotein A n=1 Tax=Rhodovulum iodosum TaxID=68291 RepID=A0ABV3XQ48_9RHOB|nr:SPOR domain-containing protein [Rhodovulum robiginosum]RSK34809.1 SPOR domain-containing protein [Rhodovulum robiginosum]